MEKNTSAVTRMIAFGIGILAITIFIGYVPVIAVFESQAIYESQPIYTQEPVYESQPIYASEAMYRYDPVYETRYSIDISATGWLCNSQHIQRSDLTYNEYQHWLNVADEKAALCNVEWSSTHYEKIVDYKSVFVGYEDVISGYKDVFLGYQKTYKRHEDVIVGYKEVLIDYDTIYEYCF